MKRIRILLVLLLFFFQVTESFAAWPSTSSRTKNWSSSEVLTETDLESSFDELHTYTNAALNATSGHKHDATTSEGPKIAVLASTVTGDTTFSGEIDFTGTGASHEFAQTVNVTGDVTASDDLSATDDVIVGDDITVAGEATITGDANIGGNLTVTTVNQKTYSQLTVKLWANYNGSTDTLNDHYNVTSVTKNSTGNYTFTIDENLANGNSAFIVTAGSGRFAAIDSQSGSSVVVTTVNNSGTATDSAIVNLVAFGD